MKSILIVEDEAIVRMHAAEIVEEAGFRPIQAEDANKALQIFETNNEIYCVFTDINMPGPMNGIELAVLLKSLRPEIPVLITSGVGAQNRPAMPKDVFFIQKPYQSNELKMVLLMLLKKGATDVLKSAGIEKSS